MSDQRQESSNPLFFNPLEPYVGLSISDLNRYLPAIQTVDEVKMTRDQMQEGIFWGDAVIGLERLPESSIDLIIAEPPKTPWLSLDESGKSMSLQEYFEWNNRWLMESHRVLRETGLLYLLCDWRYSGMYQSALSDRFHLQTRITWRDENACPVGKKGTWNNGMNDIWFASKSDDFLFENHPTGSMGGAESDRSNFWAEIQTGVTPYMKGDQPDIILRRILKTSSFKLSWVVDPFVRNGAVGVAAKKMGRRFIGFETNRDQVLMAMKRIDQS